MDDCIRFDTFVDWYPYNINHRKYIKSWSLDRRHNFRTGLFELLVKTYIWWYDILLHFILLYTFRPAILSFIEERVNVTNAVTALFAFFSTSHAVAGPLIEGRYIVSFPMIFAYVNLVSGILAVTLYVALNFTDIYKKRLLAQQQQTLLSQWRIV